MGESHGTNCLRVADESVADEYVLDSVPQLTLSVQPSFENHSPVLAYSDCREGPGISLSVKARPVFELVVFPYSLCFRMREDRLLPLKYAAI